MTRNMKKMAGWAALTCVLWMTIGLAQAQVSLRNLNGGAVSLADLQGKVVVLSFGGTWVPLASKELPALQKVADRFAGRGVQVYWVSINPNKPGARNYASDADLQAFAQKNGLRVSVLRDAEQAAYREFQLDAVPTVVILDKQGKVARKHVGFNADQGEAYGELIRDLDQLLK
ncbi:MAG: TlpA family protein disulfide reductase [Acidobacteria bacterium]|nr:TlpA family protein disulfide reductase [Acidobacteriota bacterium]